MSSVKLSRVLSCVTVPSLHLHTLSAGPSSLKQNGVYTFVITSGYTDCPLRTQFHIRSGAGYCSFR